MKIRTDFGLLWQSVKQMGADERDFSFEVSSREEMDIDIELERGVEVALDDLESTGGLLSYKGRQVLLYIPDHGSWVQSVIDGKNQGNRFHVGDCTKLDEMRQKGKFDRYTVTTDLSGVFRISGQSNVSSHIEHDAELKVCKLCLRMLNYRGYDTGPLAKKVIFEEFSISDFFATYSTQFRFLPKQLLDRRSGYSDEWSEISRRYRESRSWICECCGINLAGNKNLLHCHHVSGNKRDNRDDNLMALCADCHSKQPDHEKMYVRKSEMIEIQRLRRHQGILDVLPGWDAVLEYIDSAYEGVARKIMKTSRSLPAVGEDIENSKGEIVLTPELSWPAQRFAIVDNEEQLDTLTQVGWRAMTMEQVLKS
ncbi:HNH endonuclease [Alcanivorax sp.]|uniref:HNH endonuclease signature motif containing protein n=1 Tax=Alcanivorax sp. TaxID=1872427 RepID=UPI0025C12432|nr:HNH endonuclease [Alcanivorax sp.]